MLLPVPAGYKRALEGPGKGLLFYICLAPTMYEKQKATLPRAPPHPHTRAVESPFF
jgi:hypothetical protein